MSPTSLIHVFRTRSRAARLIGALALALAPLLLAGPATAATDHHVVIKQYAYGPASLSITAGDSVTWTNEDSVAHDVHVTSGPTTFGSPMLAKGQSWTYRFTTAGSYSYICSVHPDMTARVTVAAAPVAKPPAAQAPATHPAAVQHATGSTRTAATPVVRRSTGHRATTHQAASVAAPQTVTTAPVSQVATTTTTSLDPLLIVAGFSTAVVVFCLLLMTARPEPAPQAADTRAPVPDGGAHAAGDTMVDHRAITAGD